MQARVPHNLTAKHDQTGAYLNRIHTVQTKDQSKRRIRGRQGHGLTKDAANDTQIKGR